MHDQIARRRTCAIISHPDAGKTTLTEKFLLYAGALQLAGSVTARKNQRATTSDWMELERQRGISVSSTVLQFDYRNYRVNLLDTPGHQDFSEDTYRVLTAVDAVIMVIDAAKGIENQTRKLFQVCRRRGIPIFTFMNKMDRPALDPLSLLDELEKVLGIKACAMNWPIGSGSSFRGVYDRAGKLVHFFERTPGGAFRAPLSVHGLSDPQIRESIPEDIYETLVDEISMLDGLGHPMNAQEVLEGRLTPVFFGSAVSNFGVQLLLDGFLQHSPPPQHRTCNGQVIDVKDQRFSGFIFKIQANMDPRHRDRLAFLRVCSGRFQRNMSVVHAQTGRTIRLASSHKLFGQERETVEEAWPGDVIGLVGHSDFGIGDTLTEDASIRFDEIPRFAPEVFAYLHSTSTSQYKRFRDGLGQLAQEGVVQLLQIPSSGQRVPLLAAVGPLQFEVVQYRLKSEYDVDSRLQGSQWDLMRWVAPGVSEEALANASLLGGAQLALDPDQQPVVLFPSAWAMRYFVQNNPDIPLVEELAPMAVPA